MSVQSVTTRLDTVDAIRAHLDGLVTLDSRLAPVVELAGEVAPRLTSPGFAGMSRIICGQQLSVASARAIWARFKALDGALEPETFLRIDEALLRATGFSAGKIRTVRVIAEAMTAGELDFDHVESLTGEEAVAYLTAHKGIGPWTAEIYLMFCAGHPDVFPAGDLALQKAVAQGLGLDARPNSTQLIDIAARWSPHRAAAALLFWRYFAVIRDKEGIIL